MSILVPYGELALIAIGMLVIAKIFSYVIEKFTE